jgi:phage terminase large subunit
MSSISHSVHKLLKDQIEAMNLTSYFDTTNNKITAKNGSDFIFSGIRDDPAKIKSTEGVDVCFIEEAESISETSWQILIPTIRKPGSKFIIVFNPKNKSDPTYQRFVINTPPKTWLQKINYKDNPFTSRINK